MTLYDRVTFLLTSPDGAMYDLYNNPNIAHGFLIVTIYSGTAGLNSFLSAVIASQSFGFGLVAFFGSSLLVYLTWAFLTIAFHVIANVLGGIGELPNTLAGIGMAAAPMILTSCCSLLFTMVSSELFGDDPDKMIEKIRLAISLVGMSWGWPGILCYFSLKNAERLDSFKAFGVTMLIFSAMALIEVLNSNAF